MIEYIEHYDYGGYDLDGTREIRNDCIHLDKSGAIDDVIEWINIMCVINRGRGFEIVENLKHMGFFNKILEKKSARKIAKKIPCITNVSFKNVNMETKIYYTISEDYSKKIFQKRQMFLERQKILDTMATYIRDDFYGEWEHLHIEINKSEISHGLSHTRKTWESFGMEDIPTDFYCFCMADVLAEYIVEKKCNEADFVKTTVYWNKRARHNKKYVAEVVFSYKHRKKDVAGLKTWE